MGVFLVPVATAWIAWSTIILGILTALLIPLIYVVWKVVVD
ncbi:MAG: hypothetical protein M0T83_06545 [Nitrospiraceae bacterium]|nr:hypothetical protein [Nitrospiraceae bacterium]